MEDNGQLVHRLPLVHLLTTGGTIACVLRDGALQPLLGGDEMLASLPGVSEIARIDVEPFSSVTGWNMEPAMMLRLALRIEEVLQNEDVSGVVVTHGTDTVEETMIACSLVVSSPKPVVFAAAMRSPGVPGSDGPANLLGAIRTAASKAAYGSVVLCVNDELHAARYVTKTDCSNVHAFESPGHGPVGRVAFDGPRFTSCAAPQSKSLRCLALEESVPLIKVFTGMTAAQFEAMSSGAKGLVVEGTGAGNVPDSVAPVIEMLRRNGVPVVLSSRCLGGLLAPLYGTRGGGKALREAGVVLAHQTPSHKARIMLMVALGAGLDQDQLQALFET